MVKPKIRFQLDFIRKLIIFIILRKYKFKISNNLSIYFTVTSNGSFQKRSRRSEGSKTIINLNYGARSDYA